MKKKIVFAFLLALPATAFAEEPMKPKLGAETRAIEPLAHDGKIKGKILANAMKEGQPELPVAGTSSCKWTNDNLWLQCDVKETIGAGKEAMPWRGTLFLGWDFGGQEYRATGVDTNGSSMFMKGDVEGNKLILTSVAEQMMHGKMTKFRMTYDWSDPKAITLTNECSQEGKDFKVVQESVLTPTKKHPLPKQTAS
jgi:hypothetical protein